MMVRSRVRMAWSLQRLGRREAIFHFWSLLVGGTAGYHLLKRQELHSSFKKNRINSHWLLVRITNQRLRPPLNIQRFFLQPQFSEVKTDRAVTDFDLWCCSSPSFPCSSTSFPCSSSSISIRNCSSFPPPLYPSRKLKFNILTRFRERYKVSIVFQTEFLLFDWNLTR